MFRGNEAMKKTTDDRMAKVETRYGKTLGAAKGIKPAPKVKVKPGIMGGLKPHGVKVKITKKY
jgi:hypothetical protein